MADQVDAKKDDKDEAGENRLEMLVGLFVVVLATFLGICNVKDDNIVQKMQLQQSKKVNNYTWFQARKIRATVYQSFADQMSVPAPGETGEGAKVREEKAKYFKDKADDQELQSKEQLADA